MTTDTEIADVLEPCSCDYDQNSDPAKAFCAFFRNKLRYAVIGKTAAKKVEAGFEKFRKKRDAAYISEFDRRTEKYLGGE